MAAGSEEEQRMAEIGKVRIRIPDAIKPGEAVRVRALVVHPMEVLQFDKERKPVERNYHFIHQMRVTYNGKVVLQAETSQAVSQNPFFSFPLKVTERGILKVTFLDTHGQTYEGSAEIKF
jgi:sulfur-oxidizing protein SoxZ